jgi:acetyltransferase-like isoleucine patch superfamily enzyme
MANAEVGKHGFIASKSNIGHDTRVGDFALISALVGVAGHVVVEEGCYLGMGSLIRERVTIGAWSMVGVGSVVVSDVPPYHVVVGNPARKLRELDPAKLAT